MTETQNEAGDEFGEERLIDLLRTNRADSAAAIQKVVSGSLRAFAGNTPQYDDITLVVVKRLA